MLLTHFTSCVPTAHFWSIELFLRSKILNLTLCSKNIIEEWRLVPVAETAVLMLVFSTVNFVQVPLREHYSKPGHVN